MEGLGANANLVPSAAGKRFFYGFAPISIFAVSPTNVSS